MIWWRITDLALAVIATGPDEDFARGAQAEITRRVARSHGNLLCEEITCPYAYEADSDGNPESEEIKRLREEIEEKEGEMRGLEDDIEDLKSELRKLTSDAAPNLTPSTHTT